MAFKIAKRNIGMLLIKILRINGCVWNWLLEKDVNDDYLSDYVRKIDQPGVAICTWCKE